MYTKNYKLFNLQISKNKKDISETTRMLSIKNNVNTNNNNKFKEWVAGLTDGDGNFYISKLGYIEFSVVTEIRDISCLYALKNKTNIEMDYFLRKCLYNSRQIRSMRRYIFADLFNKYSFNIKNSK